MGCILAWVKTAYPSAMNYCFFSVTTPSSYFFLTGDTVSVNGSSATGHCSSATTRQVVGGNMLTECHQPTTSVLFDGNIPTLTGLDGDMWASQLLTLQAKTQPNVPISFSFPTGIRRFEVVMFNCPMRTGSCTKPAQKSFDVQHVFT